LQSYHAEKGCASVVDPWGAVWGNRPLNVCGAPFNGAPLI